MCSRELGSNKLIDSTSYIASAVLSPYNNKFMNIVRGEAKKPRIKPLKTDIFETCKPMIRKTLLYKTMDILKKHVFQMSYIHLLTIETGELNDNK